MRKNLREVSLMVSTMERKSLYHENLKGAEIEMPVVFARLFLARAKHCTIRHNLFMHAA
jgi:hypothetical protein